MRDPQHKQSPPEQRIPALVVQALQRALGEQLIAVVLFGSRARGDAHAESDWDLLVIAEKLPEQFFDRHLFLRRLLPTDCSNASLLARTPQEFESHLPSLYLDIALDGRILYDPQGYAAGKLRALKRTIQKTGLYRERTQDGDIWRWRKEPSDSWTSEWRQ